MDAEVQQFLTCYVMRHAFEAYQDPEWILTAENLIDQPVSWLCPRCGSVRRELWNRNTGKVEGRRYVYSEGYNQLKLDLDLGVSRVEHFRMEYLNTFHPLTAATKKKSNVTPIRRRRAS